MTARKEISKFKGFIEGDRVFFNLSECVVGKVEDEKVFIYPKEQPHEWLGNGAWVKEIEIDFVDECPCRSRGYICVGCNTSDPRPNYEVGNYSTESLRGADG